MDPMEIVREVSAVAGRAAGTDAERRVHRALARRLRTRRRRPRTETHWIRPGWAWVHAACAATGIAASVVAVDHPVTGTALAGAAVLLLLGDLSGRLALLRRLTPERATQNVVLPAAREAPVTLVVTAAVDAPALGTAERGGFARAQAQLRRRLGGRLPGPAGWTVLSLLAVAACGGARIAGAEGTLIGAVQLVPSALLILLTGHLLDTALARVGPGANADASAVAVALSLVEALETAPPRNLAVELVLAGAGGPHAMGMRRHVAARRKAGTRAEDVVVLHIAACGAGTPVWWTREGLVLPLRYHPRLVALAQDVAREEAHLRAAPHQSRTTSGARAARAARWPAIAIGCVDASGVAPHAGEASDVAEEVDPRSMRAALELALALVHRLDGDLGATSARDVPLRPRRQRRNGGADATGPRRQGGKAGEQAAVGTDPGAG